MATTVHLPDDLLSAIDRKARELKVSRNRFIVRALRRTLAQETAWSDEFLALLDELDPLRGEAVDEMLVEIKSARTSKRPPDL